MLGIKSRCYKLQQLYIGWKISQDSNTVQYPWLTKIAADFNEQAFFALISNCKQANW